MEKLPWYPFYPNDWNKKLEEHPLEIEGAWIRLCNKLHWSKTRGKGQKTVAQWAKVLRVDVDKTIEILRYLRQEDIATLHGDLSNGDSRVTLVSRRMVRDEKVRQIRKECGQKGGNPQLKKQKKIGDVEGLDNQIPTTRDNQTPTKNNGDEYEVVVKEELKGEENEKKPPPPPPPARAPNPGVKIFIDAFAESFKKKFGQPYVVSGAKEGAIAARLLQSHPIDKLLEIQRLFFAEEDEFLDTAGRTIVVFASRINKMAQRGHGEGSWLAKVKSML
jgi:hypothetical protein